MDWADLLIKAGSFLLSIGAMIYAFFASRKGAVDERFNAGSTRMDGHDERIARLEHELKALPVKDDMHALQLELVKQTGEMAEIRAVMEGNAKVMARLEAIVSRHEDHLLEGKR